MSGANCWSAPAVKTPALECHPPTRAHYCRHSRRPQVILPERFASLERHLNPGIGAGAITRRIRGLAVGAIPWVGGNRRCKLPTPVGMNPGSSQLVNRIKLASTPENREWRRGTRLANRGTEVTHARARVVAPGVRGVLTDGPVGTTGSGSILRTLGCDGSSHAQPRTSHSSIRCAGSAKNWSATARPRIGRYVKPIRRSESTSSVGDTAPHGGAHPWWRPARVGVL